LRYESVRYDVFFGEKMATRFDFRFPRIAISRGKSFLALQQRRFFRQGFCPGRIRLLASTSSAYSHAPIIRCSSGAIRYSFKRRDAASKSRWLAFASNGSYAAD